METLLKLAEPDEDRELAFDLAYFRSLTVAQRFAWMLSQSRLMAEMLVKRGHRGPAEVTKRA